MPGADLLVQQPVAFPLGPSGWESSVTAFQRAAIGGTSRGAYFDKMVGQRNGNMTVQDQPAGQLFLRQCGVRGTQKLA